jgi:ABC-type nitrate/sulfonate/bicarbonate transport system substrate-binding protein
MKVRKALLVFLIFALTIPVFANGESEKSNKMVVGIMPASVGAPVQYAYEQGYFEEANLNVELKLFPTGAPINEAIAARQIDLAASGAATIFSLANGECTLLAELCSSGGMGIYARSDSPLLSVKGEIKELPEVYGNKKTLEGVKFLGQLGTSAQLNVSKYCSQFGLENGDYTIVHMDPGPAFQAFIAGQGDAIAAFPPYSFDLMDKGAKQVSSFEDATGFSINDALFGRTAYIEKHREDVVKFVACVIRASEELKNDKLRSDFSLKFFGDNGRNYTTESMASEINVRHYLGKVEYEAPSYVFGKCFFDQGEFYVENGKIDPDKVGNIKIACNPAILNDAIGTSL